MRRFIAAMLAALMMAAALPGCAQRNYGKDGRLSIVCTIFPQYDWTREIISDKSAEADLTLLLNNRIDLHNYQPSVDDIVKISNCDLFIYVGGESDRWVGDALKGATNKNMIAINLLDVLGSSVKIEEMTEGMEEDDDHERGGQDGGVDEHDEETEYDEHVWLSLRNARVFCSVIADALSALDPNNAREYASNRDAYIAKLSALDAEYQAAVGAAPVKTLLFGDRFPFRYLVDDYDIGYYAAFAGCSAETEASFETIVFLAKKADELSLSSIMVTESSDRKIAETIIRESNSRNQQILALDSMQAVTISDVENGITYLSIMELNLDVLRDALR